MDLSLTTSALDPFRLPVILLASVVMNTRLNAVVYPQNGELKNSEIEKLLFSAFRSKRVTKENAATIRSTQLARNAAKITSWFLVNAKRH